MRHAVTRITAALALLALVTASPLFGGTQGRIVGVVTDGAAPAASTTISLAGGQWTQLTKVLAGTGLTHAYARVSPVSTVSDYVTYGVLNDGANPGERTSDGSYVAMSGVR